MLEIGKVRIWIGNRDHGQTIGQSRAYLAFGTARARYADLIQQGAPKEEITIFGGREVAAIGQGARDMPNGRVY